MFVKELTPIMEELLKQPIAFMGGLCSGMFKLNLSEEPLKSWLEKQGITNYTDDINKDNDSGPKSINIE